ncbi:hypothetical protein LQV05_002668 [Cryptococcus neoformans]|nr:hypothetical protein J007_01710 [Cryptococcus neoformans var. grubii]OXC62920.1 hypothetical protein C358_01717 [Cryptococcus neoformans var. grubii MW-RSA852]UOH80019.1 hypothetical protein LQV05_002668 [Cryptococcus neoformans]
MFETTASHLSTKKIDRFPIQTSQVKNQFRVEETEQLGNEYEYDRIAELSDSPSSTHTSSRPVTPSHPIPIPLHISIQGSPETELFKLADKAEKILGLTPGTLAYAQACLENARDKVRCITLSPSPDPLSIAKDDKLSHFDMSRGGIKEKMQTRARKAISITALGALGHQRIASVVLGAGGKEEEHQRQKIRRAADSVLYWQKEVARLEELDKGTRK